MKRCFLAITLLFVMCVYVNSQTPVQQLRPIVPNAPSTCPQDPVLSTDGHTTGDDFVAAGSSVYYAVNLKAGHSYSVEIWDDYDPTVPNLAPKIMLLKDCVPGPSVTDVTKSDPDLSGGFASRVSWIQHADETDQLSITNPDENNGYVYRIRITDTTLVNPRWSTYSGYITQYALMNNTNTAINGTLTLTQVLGDGCCSVYKLNVAIPAGQESFIFVGPNGSVNVPVNQTGFATLAFEGPAGALTADAYFVGPGVITSTFAPRNYQH